jgi:hypothetical protein
MTDDDALRALESIAARRAEFNDSHLEEYAGELPDVLHVLAALRKRGNRHLTPQARQAEFADVLRLRVWLWWRANDLERWALEGAESAGANRRELGALLGIRTGQGVVDRRDRLASLFSRDRRPDEKVARAARRDARGEVSAAGPQQGWLARHRTAVRGVAATVLEHRELVDDPEEWLVEVQHDLAEGACTPAALMVLEYAVDAVVRSPAVDQLPDAHPLRRAARDWRELAADWRRQPAAAGAGG